MLYKINTIRNSVKNIFAHPESSYWFISIVIIFNFFFIGTVWTNDSFVFITVDIHHLIPQHSILYPVLIHLIDRIVSTDNQLVFTIKILQNGLFLFSMLYLLKQVRKKVKIGFIFSSFYIFFIVQNGIFTEGFYVSLMLLFLMSLWKLYRDKTLENLDCFIMLISFFGLILIRHTGILFIIVPVLLFLEYRKYRLKLIVSVSSWLIVILVSSIFITDYVKDKLSTIDTTMYGRPAMHIIEKTFKNNPDRRALIEKKWMSYAEDNDQRQAQKFIAQEKEGGIWLKPRNEIVNYLKKKYPDLDSTKREVKTERLINQSYINFVRTLDIGLIKQYSITSALLIATSPFSAYSLIENDRQVREEDYFSKYGLQIMDCIDFESSTIAYSLVCVFIVFQLLGGIYVMKKSVKSIWNKEFNYFGKIILCFYLLQLSAHTLTTVYVARYTVTFITLLLVYMVSLIEKKSIEQKL